MGQRKKEIAEKKEILRFYTSIMRGEDENATVTNRLSAAEKLIAQLEADSSVKSAVEKLDCILGELRQALMDGSIVAEGDESESADCSIPLEMPVEEDEDEDQS